MSQTFKVACVQTNTSPDVAANIGHASALVRQARTVGAELIMLPEVVNVMELSPKKLAVKTSVESRDISLKAFQDLAVETGAWLLVGSLVVKHDTATQAIKGGATARQKFANRSFLINAEGGIVARYDKIHMFDVDLEGGETYRESKAYEPGDKAVLATTPWGALGMTICYDLRFPHLHRQLAQAGASFLSIPAAFTRPTGQAHWHVLMRARAIENGCYVFAPGQCGEHGGGRLTYGHSLIIDPWGEVLADGGEDPGFIIAEINPDKVNAARQKIPSLRHDRDYQLDT